MYPDNVVPDGFPRLPGTWNDYLDRSSEHISGDRYLLYGVVEVVPTVVEVVPDSFLVTRGTHVSGGVAEFAERDNADLSIDRAGSGRHQVAYRIRGQSS